MKVLKFLFCTGVLFLVLCLAKSCHHEYIKTSEKMFYQKGTVTSTGDCTQRDSMMSGRYSICAIEVEYPTQKKGYGYSYKPMLPGMLVYRECFSASKCMIWSDNKPDNSFLKNGEKY